jgi:hypothetical protein
MQLDAASAPITLARLREIETRVLERMHLPMPATTSTGG